MTEPDRPDVGRTITSQFVLQAAVALATTGFGVAIIAGALEYNTGWTERGPEPGYFPFWIGCLIILGSAGVLVETILARARLAGPALTVDQGRRVIAFLLPLLAFVVAVNYLGIYVAMILYLMFVMNVQSGYRVATSAVTSVATAITFFAMFEKWLRVPLAKGPLEAWLGLH